MKAERASEDRFPRLAEGVDPSPPAELVSGSWTKAPPPAASPALLGDTLNSRDDRRQPALESGPAAPPVGPPPAGVGPTPSAPVPPAYDPPAEPILEGYRLLGGSLSSWGSVWGDAHGFGDPQPPCSSSEASAREEEEEEEDEDEEDEDGTGSEASEDAGPPRQLNGEGRGGPPLRPPGQPPPERPPQPKACAPGEGGCQHMAPLKKEGAFGQPDRAVSPALAGAEPSVPLSPGRPGPQAAEGAPFSCTAGRKDKAVDPVEWSVRDVVEYFTEAGFPEQAGAFQEQEIDGKSLLLMQRADVLTGLSIRLGPALKIYEYHVKLLQRSHFQDEEPPPEPFPA
ncbi:atherin-like [Serinus canaria]|uniref:atherin-like n=1 Tax=Serinus canaria TaxID=9135 RepID=UPI0021CCB99F|nr:atherin-like [Serinus canaria]